MQYPVCLIDADGKIIAKNRSFDDIFAFKNAANTGDIFDALKPGKNKAAFKNLSEFLHSDQYEQTLTLHIKNKSGGKAYYKWSSEILEEADAGGKAFYLVQGVLSPAQKEMHIDYQQLVENLNEIVYKLDMQSRVIYITPNIEAISGYTAEEIIGKQYTDFIYPDDLPGRIEQFRYILSGHMEASEYRFITKKNEIVWVRTNARPVYSGKRIVGVQGVLIDISDRKAMEKTLKERERRHKLARVAGQVGIWDWDLTNNEVYIDANLKSILGYREDEVADHPKAILSLFNREDIKQLKQIYQRYKNGVIREHEFEHRLNHKNKSIRWFLNRGSARYNQDGEAVRLIGTLTDITDRKRAEIIHDVQNQISNAIHTSNSLIDLYKLIQQQLGRVIDTSNFTVIFHDKEKDQIYTSYSSDQNDKFTRVPAKKTLSENVIKNGEPLLLTSDDIHKLVEEGKVRRIGTPCKVWMGIPLFSKKEPIGALVIQNYEDKHAYSSEDLHLLNFASKQISISIEQKFAEEQLRHSEESYHQLFDNATDAIYIQKPNGEFIDVNHGAERLYGYPKSFFIGKTPEPLAAPGYNDLKEVKRCLAKAMEGTPQRFEFWGIRKNGEIFPKDVVLHRGQYFGQDVVIAFAREITAQKMAEKALRESEKKYRNLIENSNDAIYLLYNRKFEMINNKFQKMFEVTLEDVQHPDFDFMQMVAPESREMVTDRIKRMAEGRKISQSYQFTALSKGGKRIEVETSVSYIEYKDGIASQGILRDISERKKLEEQLHQAQKMEAIGKLAGGIAHDFNNILTAINGYAELGLLKSGDNNALNQNFNNILEAGERASELVKQLLAYSRKQIIQPQTLNLNDRIRKLLGMLQRMISEDIKLNTEFDNSVFTIKADPTQIEQVIFNLILNAQDAIQSKRDETFRKQITIATENLIIDAPKYRNGEWLDRGNYVQLSIADTGIGMDEETQSKIFDPFFTTKEFGKGSGLGLSTVYGIVKQNNAAIEVDSRTGEGTCITIFWPAIESLQEERTDAVKSEKAHLRGNETILFVEDNADVLDFSREGLISMGYNVKTARNGAEALEVLKENNTRFDLLITDVVMPEVDGLQLAYQLNEMDPKVKIIFTSGYVDTNLKHAEILRDRVAYIQKPYSLSQLTHKVREVLNQS